MGPNWLIPGKSFAALAALVVLSSCDPGAYAPPAQIAMPSGPEPANAPDPDADLLVAMSDPDADAHIRGDVFGSEAGSEWRFTGLHPAFRMDVRRVSGLTFYLRCSNTAEMLRARGPVTFDITINGTHFRSPRFATEGDIEYRRPIPDGWIQSPGPVEIRIDVSPPWHAPDGMTYGMFLNSVGFEKR